MAGYKHHLISINYTYCNQSAQTLNQDRISVQLIKHTQLRKIWVIFVLEEIICYQYTTLHNWL
jgi:hypothetical protein